MSLYNRIEHLCKQKNISITDLSRNSGVNRASFSDLKMKRRKSLAASSLTKIADYLNVSVDYLLTGEKQKENTPPKKGVRISVLGSIAAGVPIEAIEDEVDWEEIPIDWTRGGQEYFGLRVEGDSMYPVYKYKNPPPLQ